MFRQVSIPVPIAGKLYLTSMPGRFESISEWGEEMIRLRIGCLVCLNPFQEISERSPDYYSLIMSRNFEWKLIHFPIPDFGIPSDRAAYMVVVKEIADRLISGEECCCALPLLGSGELEHLLSFC